MEMRTTERLEQLKAAVGFVESPIGVSKVAEAAVTEGGEGEADVLERFVPPESIRHSVLAVPSYSPISNKQTVVEILKTRGWMVFGIALMLVGLLKCRDLSMNC
ncbi:hypothetical protein L1887_16372 [Cichorium endivia]|nr:hypothetical protein L1887_16372 [Cichorium endivia]